MRSDKIIWENATKVAIAINVLGVMIAIWFAFYPRPYLWSALAAMLFPAVYLVVVAVYKGRISFNTSCLAFFACSFVLLFKGFNTSVIEYKYALIYASFLLLGILLLLILFSEEFQIKTKKGRTNILSSILFVFFYSFGVVVISNCLFDRSPNQIVKTTISDMKVTYGTKSQTYHWYLAPWGSNTKVDHVTVPEDQYRTVHIGDTVNVQLHQGFLSIPWYDVTLP